MKCGGCQEAAVFKRRYCAVCEKALKREMWESGYLQYRPRFTVNQNGQPTRADKFDEDANGVWGNIVSAHEDCG